MTRSNSNAQSMSYRPHDRCCNNFPLLGSSPTTVLDRMVEAPGNLNSCTLSANRVIEVQSFFFQSKSFAIVYLVFKPFTILSSGIKSSRVLLKSALEKLYSFVSL